MNTNTTFNKKITAQNEKSGNGYAALLRIEEFEHAVPECCENLKNKLHALADVRKTISGNVNNGNLAEEEAALIRGIFKEAYSRRFEIINALSGDVTRYNKAFNGVLDLYRRDGLNAGAQRAIGEELSVIKREAYPT